LIPGATSCKKSISWSVIDVADDVLVSAAAAAGRAAVAAGCLALGCLLPAKANYKRPKTPASWLLAAKTSDGGNG